MLGPVIECDVAGLRGALTVEWAESTGAREGSSFERCLAGLVGPLVSLPLPVVFEESTLDGSFERSLWGRWCRFRCCAVVFDESTRIARSRGARGVGEPPSLNSVCETLESIDNGVVAATAWWQTIT